MTPFVKNTVAILQPSYLPWCGYFNQILKSSSFVFYDDVQYDKNGWRNRNVICNKGIKTWLTVPVVGANRFGQLIKDVSIDTSKNWKKKHLLTIQHAYSKTKYFDEFYPILQLAIEGANHSLVDLNIKLIHQICEYIGLRCAFYRSSEMNVIGGKTERLVNICKLLGGERYLSGSSGINYIEVDQFKLNGIDVEWQKYDNSLYQNKNESKTLTLSIIDLIFNRGKESLNYIK